MRPSDASLSILAKPEDANTIGTIFGGRILQWMDMAAAICARRHTALRVATVSVSHIQFHSPIRVGDVMDFHACVTRTFAASLEIQVWVYSENTYSQKSELAARWLCAVEGRRGRWAPGYSQRHGPFGAGGPRSVASR